MSPLASIYFFKSWSRYSNTKYNFLSTCRTSCKLKHKTTSKYVSTLLLVTRAMYNKHTTCSNYLTMFGCSSSFSNDISLIAVDGTPSHSLHTCKRRVLHRNTGNSQLTHPILSSLRPPCDRSLSFWPCIQPRMFLHQFFLVFRNCPFCLPG